MSKKINYKCHSMVLFAPAVNAKEDDAKMKVTKAVPTSVAKDILELTFTVADRNEAFAEVYKVLATKLKAATGTIVDPKPEPPSAWSIGSGGLHEDTRPLKVQDHEGYKLWELELKHNDANQVIRAFASLRVRTVAV